MPEAIETILQSLRAHGLAWAPIAPGEPCESVMSLYLCVAAHDGERVRRYPIAKAPLPGTADLFALRAYTVDALRRLDDGKAKDYGNQSKERRDAPAKGPLDAGISLPLRTEQLTEDLAEHVTGLSRPGLPQADRVLLMSMALTCLSLLFVTTTMTDLDRP